MGYNIAIQTMKKNFYILMFLFFSCFGLSAQWEKVNLNAPGAYDFFAMPNGNFVLSDYSKNYGGNTYGLYLSEDEGETWSKLPYTANNYTSHLIYNGYAFIGANKGLVLRSDDNGKNWTEFSYASAFSKSADELGDIYGIAAYGNRIYMSCFGSGICYSEDNGESWNATDLKSLEVPSQEANGFYTYVLCVFKGKLYAMGADSIFVLDEDGKSWLFLEKTLYASSYTIINDALYVGSGVQNSLYGLRKTEDGINWIELELPEKLWDRMVRCLFNDGQNIYIGTSSFGVYYTNDDGKTWNEYSKGLPEFIPNSGLYAMPINFGSYNGKLYAAFFDIDGGLFKSPLVYVNPDAVTDIEGDKNKVRVYPNPVASLLTVELGSPSSNLSITIYDILGQIVGNYNYGVCQENVVVNVENLPLGTYIYSVKNGETEYKGKILKK